MKTTKNQFSHLSSFSFKFTLLHSTFLRSIQTSRRYMQKKEKNLYVIRVYKNKTKIKHLWISNMNRMHQRYRIFLYHRKFRRSHSIFQMHEVWENQKTRKKITTALSYLYSTECFFLSFRSLIFCLSTFPFGFEYGKIDFYLILQRICLFMVHSDEQHNHKRKKCFFFSKNVCL